MLCATVGRGVPPSKIVPPAPAAGFVPRERLRALLEEATTTAAVTTLGAHAGTGKTQLLAHWARMGQVATAWVSLDPGDDRPGRPWAAVAQAVVRSVSELAGASGSDAEDPRAPLTVGELLAVLETLPVELRLVLDDIQELSDPRVLDELRTMLRYRPARLRLVLAGRTPPPLSLARLRLQGGVIDFPGEQLRFSIDEAASLAARCGVKMSRGQVADAHALTGGWAAGLRLTAVALRRAPDVGRLLATFPGAERSISDYLGDEIVGRLPDADRAFLEDISVGPAVAPTLATALTGREDAPAVLERLERETSLVTADRERGDYAMQTLLRASLDDALARRQPERHARLHVRAAQWCAAHGRPARAFDHARSSGDDALLAHLLRAWVVPLLLTGDHEALRRTAAVLGPAAVAADPGLRLLGPALAALSGEPGVRHGTPLGEAAELRALRAVAAVAAAGDQPHDPAGPPERPGDDAARRARAAAAETLAAAVNGATRLLVADDPGSAVDALRIASARAGEHGHDHLAMQCASLLATAAALAGDVGGMVAHGAETIARAGRAGWEETAWAVAARATLAHGSLLGARPKEAGEHAAAVLAQVGDALPPAQRLLVHVVHGAADADASRSARGLEEMQRARTAFADRELAPGQAALVALLEHETAVLRGRPDHARAVRRWLGGRVGTTGEVLLMSAREALAAGGPVPLAQALHPVLDGTTPTLRPEAAIEALLLVAGAAHLDHDPAGARRLLIDALARAAPVALMRPFTHAPWSVRELMAHQVGTFGAADRFARRALAAGARGRPERPTVLSDRESTILRLLPSLSTTNEIAESLHVSPNTIKTQVGAIYSKLGVTDRRAAVVAAYDAGLLDDAHELITVPRPRVPGDRGTDVIRSG